MDSIVGYDEWKGRSDMDDRYIEDTEEGMEGRSPDPVLLAMDDTNEENAERARKAEEEERDRRLLDTLRPLDAARRTEEAKERERQAKLEEELDDPHGFHLVAKLAKTNGQIAEQLRLIEAIQQVRREYLAGPTANTPEQCGIGGDEEIDAAVDWTLNRLRDILFGEPVKP